MASAWFGIIGYTLQIYFDFGGYSDMAIGLGKMFGFDFEENFSFPYIAESITEFWRRWHISLSTWFKDYVYFPLGGSRVKASRLYLNLMIVWMLTGFWHGASWTFIAWGVYYGLIISLEKGIWGNFLLKMPRPLRHIYSLLIVMIGWVFFRANDFGYAAQYISTLFGFGHNGIVSSAAIVSLIDFWYLILIGVALSIPSALFIKKMIVKKLPVFESSAAFGIVQGCFYIILLWVSIVHLANSTYNPFIYFRF